MESLIAELWQEHKEAPFPNRYRGKDINGIHFVLLDADVAGCIATFLKRNTLDAQRLAILGLRYHDLGFILPILNEEGATYFWRLERLAELVLREIARRDKGE